jgi:hypothetical protein
VLRDDCASGHVPSDQILPLTFRNIPLERRLPGTGRVVSEYNPFSPEWLNAAGSGTLPPYYVDG